MSDDRTNISDIRTNFSGVCDMTAVSLAAKYLREIAEPCPAGDTVKAAIGRAADRVAKFVAPHWAKAGKWHFGRAEDIWQKEARGIWSEEMDAIRAAREARKAEADAASLGRARNELALLKAHIARVEALFVQDPEHTGPHVDALRSMVGREDRSVDRGAAE